MGTTRKSSDHTRTSAAHGTYTKPTIMSFYPNEPEQSRRLQAVLTAADISSDSLWLYYFSIGGSMGECEVEAYVQGMFSVPELERDLLAMAANELTDDAAPHAPYAEELRKGDPTSGPQNISAP